MASCGVYLADRKDGIRDALYADWVAGFMSSYNMFSSHPQVSPIPDQPTTLAYLDKYCRENPLSYVSAGVMNLIGDLGG